jgi:signal peptidase I
MASTTKTKGPSPEPSKPSEPKSKGSAATKSAHSPESARPSAMRETIESVVVAFILAFMFKTFEAEAFVIPTGSMAPTLYGRNKAAHCPMCNTDFTIGASDEVETETDYVIPGARIDSAICPNCRYRLGNKDIYDVPVFKGDGILVNKFSFEIRDPQRWQVVVFKYPEEPKTNYIKRCVALPNETICIRQGNLYGRTEQGEWRILRKDDPNKQRVLQMNVYDNDHPERPLLDKGWPERWAAVKKADGPNAIAGWSTDTQGWIPDGAARSFHLPLERAAKDYQWFRYRHYVPNEEAWRRAAQDLPLDAQAKLITDFCGYNAFSSSNGRIVADDLGFYWVGDLTVNCRIDVQKTDPKGQVVLELNEGPRVYRCRIDLASGRATLVYAEPRDKKDPGQEHKLADAETRFVGTGQHDLSFANVDDRLCLWVDNRLIDFGPEACYSAYGGSDIQRPWDEDLIPAGIAVRGAEATVSHLLLQRDVYYRNDFVHQRSGPFTDESSYENIEEYDGVKEDLVRNQGHPAEWFREYESHLASRQTGPGQRYENILFEFTMGPDEFFMMGDNSPRSKDSRLWWNTRHAAHNYSVPRDALVGKAFFIYWPHGIPFLNDGRGYPDGPDSILANDVTGPFFYNYTRDPNGDPVLDLTYPKRRVPFYPDIARMHRIR